MPSEPRLAHFDLNAENGDSECAAIFGAWLWIERGYGVGLTWLNLKFALVMILVAYHVYCGMLLQDFKRDRNRHGHVFYRWLNEFPVLILIAVVLLAVLKPF